MSIHNRVEASPHAREELFAALERAAGQSELGDMLTNMKEFVAKAELTERERSTLEKLELGVENASLRYLESVIEHFAASEKGRPADLRAEKDEARRRAHDALIDAVRIFLRNAENFGVEEADRFRSFMVSPDDSSRRRWLGRNALVHAFNLVADTVSAHAKGK